MAEKILLVIFMIPIYGFLIWTLLEPEDSMLYGEKWMYKEEPEFSEEAIRFHKFLSILCIVVLTIFLISFFFDIYFLKFILILLPIIFILGLIKIF